MNLLSTIKNYLSLKIGLKCLHYENSILPPKSFRFCGSEFGNDKYYLDSAKREAKRLINDFALSKESHILEVGCGAGRLAIGLIAVMDNVNYYGIDVDKRSIQWCKRYIASKHKTYQFKHINMKNARYNPSGEKNIMQLPFQNETFSIVYLYSVFSHLEIEDIRFYLKEFQRLLKPMGRIFFTGFVEENVPNITLNPPNYRMNWGDSPLHCVRYNKEYLLNVFREYGFKMDTFNYETETNGQSAIYLSKI